METVEKSMHDEQKKKRKRTSDLKESAKKIILAHIKTHGWKECRIEDFGKVLYGNEEFVALKKAKQKTFNKGIIAKQRKNGELEGNTEVDNEVILLESCERTAQAAVSDLLEAGMVTKHKEGRVIGYSLQREQPRITNLYNREIAIYEIKSGDSKSAKEMIDANITDKDVIVIPLEGFLLCTMKNRKEDDITESQLDYIRDKVSTAFRKADGKVSKKKSSKSKKKNNAVESK